MVLAIVGLLLGGLMYTLSAQTEARNLSDAQRRLEEAKEALLGFAIANGRLPCPARYVSGASNSAGQESFCPAASGSCVGTETTTVQSHGNCSNYFDGFLPATTLGLQPTDSLGFALDPWSNRIRYAVASAVNDPGTACPATGASATAPGYTSTTNLKANGVGCLPDNVVVCASESGVTATTCGTATQVTNQQLVVAVVLSTGKNGALTCATCTDEAANTNGDGVFVYHEIRPTGATAGGEFDDRMVWIPVGLLYSRLIAAGVLP